MGQQLELFGDKTGPTDPVAAVSEEQLAAALPPDLPGQMDLFGDRWLRASAAQAALEAFDLEAASAALREVVRRYPQDAALLERATLVAKLAKSLRPAKRASRSVAESLAALDGRVPPFLRPAWHRRVAQRIEEEGGEGALLGTVPAGFHWLRAGEPLRAEASLRVTLQHHPGHGRARAYLGDALATQGRIEEARIAYRDALASAPLEVDFAGMVDRTVAGLQSGAQQELDLPGAPAQWAAALGILESLFIPPSPLPADWVDGSVLARLAPGQRFYRWLVAELAARDAQRIACRREMKALCPRLLKERLLRTRN